MNAPALPQAWGWTVRIICGIVFFALLFQSWRIAQADLLANSQRPGDLDRAIALEPENEKYRLWKASADLFVEGVPTARLEAELREILKQNPHNAEAIMDLGLIAESRGGNPEAERLLKQAAQFDLTFKPAWTLINFYYRTSQLEKMWPEVRRALDLTTRPDMSSNVQIVYDLCWRTGANPEFILGLIPPHPDALLGYFSYLVWHNYTDAAAQVYPRALPFANASNPFHRAIFGDFCNQQFLAHRIDQAVNIWNSLVAKGLLVSTELHPDRGESIANPIFQFPFERSPFGWSAADIATTYTQHSVLFDFNGNQPDLALVLNKNLPVLPGHDYVLTWTADGGGITRPSDPKEIGLQLSFYDGDRKIPAVCPAFLAPEKDRRCSFHVPSVLQALSMRLVAERLPGSVRIRGTLQVTGFHLAFRETPASKIRIDGTLPHSASLLYPHP